MFNLARKYKGVEGDQGSRQPEVVTADPLDQEAAPTLSARSVNEKIGVPGKDIDAFARHLLSLLARELEASQGVYFVAQKKEGKDVLKFLAGYAFEKEPEEVPEIEFGEGFTGQVAGDGKPMVISEVPEGYLSIVSGLGKASPASIIIFPVINGKEVLAVIELASFRNFTEEHEAFLMDISSYIAPLIKKATPKK